MRRKFEEVLDTLEAILATTKDYIDGQRKELRRGRKATTHQGAHHRKRANRRRAGGPARRRTAKG